MFISLTQSLFEYDAKNLVSKKTCFKSKNDPTCIDIFIKNISQNFQNILTQQGYLIFKNGNHSFKK